VASRKGSASEMSFRARRLIGNSVRRKRPSDQTVNEGRRFPIEHADFPHSKKMPLQPCCANYERQRVRKVQPAEDDVVVVDLQSLLIMIQHSDRVVNADPDRQRVQMPFLRANRLIASLRQFKPFPNPRANGTMRDVATPRLRAESLFNRPA